MAVRDTAHRKLTYEDYELIPEDGQRHEILDGEHYVSPAPTVRHQRISMRLSSRMHVFAEEHGLGEVLAAPTDVLLSRHDILQPDILFVSRGRAPILTQRNVQGAPDLVVEILSATNRHVDERLKLARYELFGVREYWVVDPVANRVHVFLPSGNRFHRAAELSVQDILTTSLLPGFEILLSDLFRA
jgi:Uma2 family endonuclease